MVGTERVGEMEVDSGREEAIGALEDWLVKRGGCRQRRGSWAQLRRDI